MILYSQPMFFFCFLQVQDFFAMCKSLLLHTLQDYSAQGGHDDTSSGCTSDSEIDEDVNNSDYDVSYPLLV